MLRPDLKSNIRKVPTIRPPLVERFKRTIYGERIFGPGPPPPNSSIGVIKRKVFDGPPHKSGKIYGFRVLGGWSVRP